MISLIYSIIMEDVRRFVFVKSSITFRNIGLLKNLLKALAAITNGLWFSFSFCILIKHSMTYVHLLYTLFVCLSIGYASKYKEFCNLLSLSFVMTTKHIPYNSLSPFVHSIFFFVLHLYLNAVILARLRSGPTAQHHYELIF